MELLIRETALWRLEDRAESWLRNIEPRNQRDRKIHGILYELVGIRTKEK